MKINNNSFFLHRQCIFPGRHIFTILLGVNGNCYFFSRDNDLKLFLPALSCTNNKVENSTTPNFKTYSERYLFEMNT